MKLHQQVRAGLSLLEVLLALAIFLFALVGIGQLMSISHDQALEIQNLNRATMLLQSKMNEVQAGAIPLMSQAESSFDEDPNWYWSMESEADSAENLFRVTITVTRKTPNGEELGSWSLHQLVFEPNARGTIESVTTPSTTNGP